MEKLVVIQEKETYMAPNIEIVQIETEQNILAAGSAPDMPGEDW